MIVNGKNFVVALFFSFFLINYVATTAMAGWQSEYIDRGLKPSLAFDTSGNPGISYSQFESVPTHESLGYAHYYGGSWVKTIVDDSGIKNSLAFDANGNPAIAYVSYDGVSAGYFLKYAHFNGTSWDIITLDTRAHWHSPVSLLFDASGYPSIAYISYEDVNYFILKFVKFNGTSWETTGIDTSGEYFNYFSFGSLSLALDSSGNPAIAYEGGRFVSGSWEYSVVYNHFNGVSWDRTIVDSSTGMGSNLLVSLAFDASGNPAISYSNRYAHFNGTSWDITSLDWLTLGARALSLAFDKAGNPAIGCQVFSAYGDFTSLMYAHFNGVSWDKTVVGSTGGELSFAFDAADNPGMATSHGVYSIGYVHFVSDNRPPIASAGVDQTVHIGKVVTLDGSLSSDPEGNVPLSYNWSFTSLPAGSIATLLNPTSVNPTFTPDIPGNYVIQLIVIDSLGAASARDLVTISTLNSAPVADAGVDQSIIFTGSVVQLDGTLSYDVDGDSITYQWSFISRPAGSTAVLAQANTVKPTFVADVHGDYVIQLAVSDSWTQSVVDTVMVSFMNVVPVANAGTSQSILLGLTVTLDGSRSSDANGDLLAYRWGIISAPLGSTAVIANPTAMVTTFVPDLIGTYVIQLVVNDGYVDSAPSAVQVQVTTLQTIAIEVIQACQTQITSLSQSVFKNPNMQNTFLNKLNAVIANIEAGNYADALGQLQNDILAKTDGCATQGAPDKNDWIKDCGSQGIIYPCILDAITKVRELLQ